MVVIIRITMEWKIEQDGVNEEDETLDTLDDAQMGHTPMGGNINDGYTD